MTALTACGFYSWGPSTAGFPTITAQLRKILLAIFSLLLLFSFLIFHNSSASKLLQPFPSKWLGFRPRIPYPWAPSCLTEQLSGWVGEPGGTQHSPMPCFPGLSHTKSSKAIPVSAGKLWAQSDIASCPEPASPSVFSQMWGREAESLRRPQVANRGVFFLNAYLIQTPEGVGTQWLEALRMQVGRIINHRTWELSFCSLKQWWGCHCLREQNVVSHHHRDVSRSSSWALSEQHNQDNPFKFRSR